MLFFQNKHLEAREKQTDHASHLSNLRTPVCPSFSLPQGFALFISFGLSLSHGLWYPPRASGPHKCLGLPEPRELAVGHWTRRAALIMSSWWGSLVGLGSVPPQAPGCQDMEGTGPSPLTQGPCGDPLWTPGGSRPHGVNGSPSWLRLLYRAALDSTGLKAGRGETPAPWWGAWRGPAWAGPSPVDLSALPCPSCPLGVSLRLTRDSRADFPGATGGKWEQWFADHAGPLPLLPSGWGRDP